MDIQCMGCMGMHDVEIDKCPHCGFKESEYKSIGYHLPIHSTLVDTYIVGRAIGYGGFGVTYVGYNAILDKKVAIKEYLPGEFATRSPGEATVSVFTGDKEKAYYRGLERFEQEAKKLSKLKDNEGIVEIYDCFRANNTVYIVMECLEGETLKELLKRKKKLSVEKATDIIAEVLKILSKVHQAGIIHRDISPENIFITKEGGIKLIDFGAAKNAATGYSKSLSVIIKQGYAPPEQYFSKGRQGSWTDVYACAATYYKLLTGITPEDSMERKGKDNLKPPSRYGIKIKKSQENALLNALALDIEKRTATSAEFLNGITAQNNKIKRTKAKNKKADIGRLPWGIKIAIGFAVVLLLMAFTAGYNIVRDNFITDEEVINQNQVYVPNVINLSYDEAEKILSENGLVAVRGDWVSSDDALRDTVMGQEISAGEIVDIGTEIKLDLSSGGINSVMGDYVGLSKEAAMEELDGLHIYANFEEVSSSMAKGCIVSQSIPCDEMVRRGSEVTLQVSKGMDDYEEGETVVPNLCNNDLETGLALAEESQLYIAIEKRSYSDVIPKGSIISQSYNQGDKVAKGTVVVLEVSDGVEMIEIPSYYLTKADDYKKTLEELGFECCIEYIYDENYVGEVFPGYVLELDVEAGEKYPIGTAVTIYEMDGLLFDASIVNNMDRITEKYKVGEEIKIEMELKAEQGNSAIPWSAKFVLNYDNEYLQFSGVEGNVTSEIINNRIENYESSLILRCQGNEKDYYDHIVVSFIALKEGATNILVSDYDYPYDQGFDSGFIVETSGYYYVASETAELISYIIEE